MFAAETYAGRRSALVQKIGTGVILFPGNNQAPINYPDNAYPFRQDSTFLYYWGLDTPGLAAILDADSGEHILYGDEVSVDDVIWSGPQPSLTERGASVGVEEIRPLVRFAEDAKAAVQKQRKVHFLPTYRGDTTILIADILEHNPADLNGAVSTEMIQAVVAQRSVKSAEEVAQLEEAVAITREMHLLAMQRARPGMIEREIVGAMEGIAVSGGGRLSFPVIFSIHGETLHNHFYGNTLTAGRMVVCDAGAESSMHYAGDITRTTPVAGKFTPEQRDIYEIVLRAQVNAIERTAPGTRNLDVHLGAARDIVDGLKQVGLMQGDSDDAVAAGAQALFMPHGLGHMIGLDVHDMEGLGEDFVGYDSETNRSSQFGLKSLRLARKLEPGFVLTVEPGIYFIPKLIDLWQEQDKCTDFINYDRLAHYKTFGGIRIEDNVVVTDKGCRVLGEPIPKTVAEVEETASQ